MPAQIDRSTFESLRQMTDAGFVDELVNTFLEDTPIQLRDMSASLKKGDAEVFRRAAHSIKSNAATFGAVQLSDLARELEAMGKEGDLAKAAGKLAALQASFEAAAKELRELTE